MVGRKKVVIVILFLLKALPFYSQTREDIIARIPNAENLSINQLSEVMPDWSEYFSIDDDFDVTDLAKYRWVDFGEGNYEWQKYESLSFNFYVPECVQLFKHVNTGITTIKGKNYSFPTFSITAEIEPDYFLTDVITEDKVSLFLKQVHFGLIQKVSNRIKYTGFSSATNFSVPISSNNYIGTVTISNNNAVQYEAGTHLFTFDPSVYELRSDGSLGPVSLENTFGTDEFVIKILSFNEKTKLLLLETSNYIRPFVPMEDFLVSTTEYINGGYSDVTFYENPDFLSEKIITLTSSEYGYFSILKTSFSFEENNGLISKWYYVKDSKTKIEGWLWGSDLKIQTCDYLDPLLQTRFSYYNRITK